MLGAAESWDPGKNSITVARSDEQTQTFDYHIILVATGSDYADHMLWKLVGTSQEPRDSLAKLRKEVGKAKSIVIGVGGATGVEFAGEFGHEYARQGRRR